MRKKNICIVSEKQQILGIGGTETVSFLLKEELTKRGFNVWSAFFIACSQTTKADLLFPDANYYSKANKSFLIRMIIKHRIDIIIIQGECDNFLMDLCIEAKNATQVKLVCSYHFNPLMRIKVYDDYIERVLYRIRTFIRPLYKLYFEIRRQAFTSKTLKIIRKEFRKHDIEYIDAFVSLNKKYTEFFQNIYDKQYSEKFHTIPNPIILDNCQTTYDKENIILFVGRLTAQKRLDRLLYIWGSIHKQHPDWKLVIVGDGNYSIEYKILANRLKLGNVEFAGQQPSEEYFKKSKIICMTSSHEGLPMVLIEAQKHRCVPITYNSFESATDIVENMHNGILIKPFEQGEYAKSLNYLISNEDVLNRMASNGIVYVRRFDIKTIIKYWIKLFNAI